MEIIPIVLFCTIILPVLGTDEGKVMNSISGHIGMVVLQCEYEMHFKKEVIDEFQSFWNPKHDIKGMNLGCAVACVLKTLQLMERGGQLKKDNAVAFLKANGADPIMSSKVIELFNLCSHAAVTKRPENGCILGLEIAKCFRYGIFRLQWAPKFWHGPEAYKTTKNSKDY